MNTPQQTLTETVHVQAHYSTNRKLGHWTTGRRFEVRAMRGAVVLDLRSPEIPQGDIEIELLADHSMIKLLVPDDALVDTWDLDIVGRGRVKDGPFEPSPTSRRVTITGQLRHAEIRVRRSGLAVLAAMFTREAVADVRRAHKDGTIPTVFDPANTPPGTPRATK
jgi:hypothetical protein